MDHEKFVEELLDGPLGDLARERLVTELCDGLAADYVERFNYETDADREQDRAFMAEVAEWIREQYS